MSDTEVLAFEELIYSGLEDLISRPRLTKGVDHRARMRSPSRLNPPFFHRIKGCHQCERSS